MRSNKNIVLCTLSIEVGLQKMRMTKWSAQDFYPLVDRMGDLNHALWHWVRPAGNDFQNVAELRSVVNGIPHLRLAAMDLETRIGPSLCEVWWPHSCRPEKRRRTRHQTDLLVQPPIHSVALKRRAGASLDPLALLLPLGVSCA